MIGSQDFDLWEQFPVFAKSLCSTPSVQHVVTIGEVPYRHYSSMVGGICHVMKLMRHNHIGATQKYFRFGLDFLHCAISKFLAGVHNQWVPGTLITQENIAKDKGKLETNWIAYSIYECRKPFFFCLPLLNVGRLWIWTSINLVCTYGCVFFFF